MHWIVLHHYDALHCLGTLPTFLGTRPLPEYHQMPFKIKHPIYYILIWKQKSALIWQMQLAPIYKQIRVSVPKPLVKQASPHCQYNANFSSLCLHLLHHSSIKYLPAGKVRFH